MKKHKNAELITQFQNENMFLRNEIKETRALVNNTLENFSKEIYLERRDHSTVNKDEWKYVNHKRNSNHNQNFNQESPRELHLNNRYEILKKQDND